MSTQAETVSRTSWGVVTLAFLAVLADGFDTAILALIVPQLAREWDLTPAVFSFPLVLTNVGVVLGYIFCGRLGVVFGPRKVLVAGTALFGLATIASALVIPTESMTLLTITRVMTGIGLGVVLPTAIVVATNNISSARRQVATVGVTMGLTSGAALAGFTGTPLMQAWGVAGVLWLSGLVPLVVAGALAVVKIASTPAPTKESKKEASALRLFHSDVRTSTLALWAAAFMIFVVSYTLKSWLPTLLNLYGLDQTTAGVGLGFLSLGGLFGGLMLMYFSAKFGAPKALVVLSLVAAVAIACIAKVPMETPVLLAVILVAGSGVVAGQIGQAAMAVSLYSQEARGTGVGWAAALGRMGSIAGPAIAGVFLALAWPAQDIVLMLVAPIIATVLIWAFLAKRGTKAARADEPSAELDKTQA
ncbi:AAHS family 4-hydroxybenzoate transporter-like MFS transporter [Paenarthrobacter nicotinovorans]|uniref:MFS transporter n=1 Tax=Paenarthrobacter nicotinovorans TaxID=29320 RepID=UPI002781B4B8|nr:MFS transporter [Paenarthrobacter nicotinovorans]MDP9936900.1 AAHS family 4-hydroxybenzoate transporter-like MFS transporter [Paenarthrobacter nicotinovorans]